MSEQPTEQLISADSGTHEEYGWHRVAQEMHAWHPGLQEHARRHLEQKGLLHLVVPTEAEGGTSIDTAQQNQHVISNTRIVNRIARPTTEYASHTATTEYVTSPFDISLRDVTPDSIKQMSVEDVVFAHGTDEESLRHFDEAASKLYGRCVDIMNTGSVLQRYALATIVARGIEEEGFDTENGYNTFLLMRLPPKLVESGLNPTDYENYSEAARALANSKGIDTDDDHAMDAFYEEVDELEENTLDPDGSIRDQIKDEILGSVDDEHASEIGRLFMNRWGMDDVLDVLTVLKLDTGNIYSNRLLLRFFEASGKYTEQHNNIDVVACYQEAVSAVEQKIEEGVIPIEFRQKIQLYHPRGFEFVDKMVVAINNDANNWAGYYHSGNGNGGTFSIVEDYSD